jgi:hypothetical protein
MNTSERAATHRTCATCKRTLPTEQLQPHVARCWNRPACRKATAAWLGREKFPAGVTCR